MESLISKYLVSELLETSNKNIYVGKHGFLTNDGHAKVTVERCYRGKVEFENRLVNTSSIENYSDNLNYGCCIINTRNSKYLVEEIIFP